MALAVTFDHAQWRYKDDRIGCVIGGGDLLDPEMSSNVVREPVHGSLMLRPRCYDDAFFDSNAAPYDKLGLTAFGSPAGLEERDRSGTGTMKALFGEPNTPIVTAANYPENQPWYVSIFHYSAGQRGILFECGWNSTATLASGTGLRVYVSGEVEVWRGGEIVHTGRASAGKENEYIRFALIPCRRRELLFFNDEGDGFGAVFADIAENAATPVIVPSSMFWFNSPEMTTNVVIAPMKFHTSGYALSSTYQLAESPAVADTRELFDNATFAGGAGVNYKIWGDEPYMTGAVPSAAVSLRKPDGTAFVQTGTDRDCRLRLDLSGSGAQTPMVYAAEIGFKTVAAQTNSSESYDATDDCTGLEFALSDGEGITATVEFCKSADLAANVAFIETQKNRPLLIQLDGVTLLNGRADVQSRSHLRVGEAERLIFDVEQTTKALKRYQFRERKPLDGMYISRSNPAEESVLRWLLRLVGTQDSAIDLENSNVRLQEIPAEKAGEFIEVIDRGATAWETLTRLMEDQLGGWYFGSSPTLTGNKFTVKSQTTMNAQAVAFHLYWTTSAAITAGVASDDAWKHVARAIDEQVIDPELNEVIVTGIDPRTNLPIGSIKRGVAAQDPTLAPSLRPANWQGEPLRAGVINRAISTLDMADLAAEFIYELGSPLRFLYEIECEMMIRANGLPVWRGDKVNVEGIGDAFVVSMTGSINTNPSAGNDFQNRPFRYVLSNRMGSTGGRTASEITAAEIRKSRLSVVQRRRAEGVSGKQYASLNLGFA